MKFTIDIKRYTKRYSKCCSKCYSLAFFLAAMLVSTVSAEEAKKLNWGLDFSAGYQQQTFESATAKLTQVNIVPSLQYENWDFSLVLPWYKTDGGYYLNGKRSNFVSTCPRFLSLSPAQLLARRIKTGATLEQQQAHREACNTVLDSFATHSGVGDVVGFTHYMLAFDDGGVWNATGGFGYKIDSGDSATGLGSGTKETLIELGVNMAAEKYSLNFMLGYSFVSVAETSGVVDDLLESKNYSYANLDFSRAFTTWLMLGANYSVQQANIADGEATKIATVYGDFGLAANINLHVYTSRYGGSEYSPQSEVGVNIRYGF